METELSLGETLRSCLLSEKKKAIFTVTKEGPPRWPVEDRFSSSKDWDCYLAETVTNMSMN